jgi:hypothetical protein
MTTQSDSSTSDSGITMRRDSGVAPVDGNAGACISGQCQPVVLAEHQDVPWRLALDSRNVYWFNTGEYTEAYDGTINSIPKQGGAVTVLSTGLQGSTGIATDGAEVFFTDTGGCLDCIARVHKVPVSGGATTLLATWMDNGTHIPFGITVVGPYVYWTNNYLGGGLQRLPTSGGTVVDVVSGIDYPRALTSDATHAYFTADWSPDLFRVKLPDGPQDIVTRDATISLSNTKAIAVNGRHAYCVGDNGLFRVELASGATTWVSQTPGNGVAIDEQDIYTTNLEGGIERRSIDGGPSTLVVTGRTLIMDLVTDETNLYWTESRSEPNAGAIVKLAK